jgi:hypothetical protein
LAAVFNETSRLRAGFVRLRNDRGFDMRSMMSAMIVAAVATSAMNLAHAQFPAAPVRGAYTVEPFTPSNTITIQGTGVRLRAEPFTLETPILSHGSTGLPLTVVGIARMPEWNWYQVILKSGQKAFIRSDYTSAPSKGGASLAPAPQLAAPLPPPSRIDYPTPSVAASPAPVLAPIPLTPPQPAPVYTPSPSYTPAPVYTPTPAPAQTAPPPSEGSAISLVPRSPLPATPSENSGGLTSVDPNLTPR